jgi:hypothetical protein
MDSPTDASIADPGSGYSRAAVDDFLAAAAVERGRLEALIEEAEDREQQARAAIDSHLGLHKVMIETLLETQRELGERRREAEVTAAGIIEAAEREARALMAANRGGVAVENDDPRRPTSIDLAAEERNPFGPMPDQFVGGAPSWSLSSERETQARKESDEFFDYLRGALIDDKPLGPRND